MKNIEILRGSFEGQEKTKVYVDAKFTTGSNGLDEVSEYDRVMNVSLTAWKTYVSNMNILIDDDQITTTSRSSLEVITLIMMKLINDGYDKYTKVHVVGYYTQQHFKKYFGIALGYFPHDYRLLLGNMTWEFESLVTSDYMYDDRIEDHNDEIIIHSGDNVDYVSDDVKIIYLNDVSGLTNDFQKCVDLYYQDREVVFLDLNLDILSNNKELVSVYGMSVGRLLMSPLMDDTQINVDRAYQPLIPDKRKVVIKDSGMYGMLEIYDERDQETEYCTYFEDIVGGSSEYVLPTLMYSILSHSLSVNEISWLYFEIQDIPKYADVGRDEMFDVHSHIIDIIHAANTLLDTMISVEFIESTISRYDFNEIALYNEPASGVSMGILDPSMQSLSSFVEHLDKGTQVLLHRPSISWVISLNLPMRKVRIIEMLILCTMLTKGSDMHLLSSYGNINTNYISQKTGIDIIIRDTQESNVKYIKHNKKRAVLEIDGEKVVYTTSSSKAPTLKWIVDRYFLGERVVYLHPTFSIQSYFIEEPYR